MFDPRINIVDVEWSPFKEVSFALPLLVDLSPWRSKLAEMENKLIDTSNYTDVVFVADFPGINGCISTEFTIFGLFDIIDM
jgi:vitamin K-dependent gamma-carboxylase